MSDGGQVEVKGAAQQQFKSMVNSKQVGLQSDQTSVQSENVVKYRWTQYIDHIGLRVLERGSGSTTDCKIIHGEQSVSRKVQETLTPVVSLHTNESKWVAG